MKYINPKRLFAAILIFSFALSCLSSFGEASKENISSAVLRLHIIPNSNSYIDQALKLRVRDMFIKETKSLFSSAKNSKEAEKIAKANLSYLTKICEKEISRLGYSYPVKIEISNSHFPQKTYGKVTLPQGTYRAVKVIIGEGGGKNWWCVMFPPLCFAKGTLSLSDVSDKYLKENLTSAEYSIITADEAALTPEVRFKTAEILAKIYKSLKRK